MVYLKRIINLIFIIIAYMIGLVIFLFGALSLPFVAMYIYIRTGKEYKIKDEPWFIQLINKMMDFVISGGLWKEKN